jgi:rare lipoprotein A
VVVRINDRGPYAHGRVIDVSAAAANVIGLIASGIAPVRLEVLSR